MRPIRRVRGRIIIIIIGIGVRKAARGVVPEKAAADQDVRLTRRDVIGVSMLVENRANRGNLATMGEDRRGSSKNVEGIESLPARAGKLIGMRIAIEMIIGRIEGIANEIVPSEVIDETEIETDARRATTEPKNYVTGRIDPPARRRKKLDRDRDRKNARRRCNLPSEPLWVVTN